MANMKQHNNVKGRWEKSLSSRKSHDTAGKKYYTTGVADEGATSITVDDVPAAVDEPTIPSPTPTTQPPPPPSQDLPSTSQIIKLKQRVKKLERRNKLKVSKLRRLKKVRTAQRVDTFEDTVMDDVSKQGGIITNIDADEDVILKAVVDIAKEVVVEEIAEIEENADDKAYGRELEAELKKNIDWDEVIKQVQRKEKEDNVVMRYQALRRKPQTEAQARKNMMIYLRNMAGFKMDYFKGMTYDDIRPIFEKKFNSNVAFLKLDEEVEELRKHLQIVPNDDDDVYTEATPLALKVTIVDYEIYTENNKPYYKIKRADRTHQLYLSFLSMVRKFDKEDLEVLWKLVKERFASSKPKNFSDDFLLTTLRAMFEKPDVQAQI
nr:hypothetical protein [Tanacetum cinerariifolium]